MVDPISVTLLGIGKVVLGKLGIATVSNGVATAIGAGVVGAAVGGVIYASYLTYNYVVRWFRSRKHIANQSGRISFTIKERVTSGEYVLVQGIYDEDYEELVDGRVVDYGDLDSRLEALHDDEELVIWA